MNNRQTAASEAAKKDREINKFFGFGRVGGAEPEPEFEEEDQRVVNSHDASRYQPGYDEDLVALRVNPAARIPIYDQRTEMAAMPSSTAPPTTQPSYQQPLAPFAFPTAQAAQQPSQSASARPPLGARDYLALHHQGRPSQGLIWPANVEIGIVEICTFCPNWLNLPVPVARAIRNGWTREALAKAQLHALGALGWDEWMRAIARIQKQISSGCKMMDGVSNDKYRHNSQDFRQRHGLQNDLTASAWQFKAEYEPSVPVQTGHMPLSSLYGGVVNWPVGGDRLLMTQCLEFARSNEHLGLDTSHWAWIIQSQGLTAPPAPVGLNRDVDAYQRLNASVADPQDPSL